MNLLSLIPGGIPVKLILCTIFWLTIAGVIEFQHRDIASLKATIVKTKAALADEQAGRLADREAESIAATRAAAAYKTESDRRIAEQKEIASETDHLASLARAHAAAADRADAGLRDVFKAAAAGSCGAAGNSGPAGFVQTADPDRGMPAVVFGELDGRAGRLAAALDQSRIAGLGCQRDYAALKAQVAAPAASAPADAASAP